MILVKLLAGTPTAAGGSMKLFKNKILASLNGNPLTAKELLIKLKIDWPTNKLSGILKKIKIPK